MPVFNMQVPKHAQQIGSIALDDITAEIASNVYVLKYYACNVYVLKYYGRL